MKYTSRSSQVQKKTENYKLTRTVRLLCLARQGREVKRKSVCVCLCPVCEEEDWCGAVRQSVVMVLWCGVP